MIKPLATQHQGRVIVPVANSKAILARYTLPHPKYISAKRRGAYIPPDMPRKISFAEARPGSCVVVPLPCYRGKIGNPPQFATYCFTARSFAPLRPYQYQAATGMLKSAYGILQAPAGSGKTMVLLAMIHRRAVPALVIVPTIDIARQWRDRARAYWSELKTGIYGGGSKSEGEHTTVTTYQSADKIPSLDRYGLVCVDECHRAPCESIARTLGRCPARYRYGCTATPTRADGLEKAFTWLLGGVKHVIDREDIAENVLRVKVETVDTGLDFIAEDYGGLQNLVAEHRARNKCIAHIVLDERRAGRNTIVLCNRVVQAKALATATGGRVVTGVTPKKIREKTLSGIASGRGMVIVATYSLAAEGLDIPALETLVMAAPVGNEKIVEQACGRIARPCDGKGTPRVIDLRDGGGMCRALARKRDAVYRRLGYYV